MVPSQLPADNTRLLALLFTDVAGSTRLWERFAGQMQQAVAGHDALSREAVQRHGGQVVKMVGDGLYAVFEDPLDGLRALIDLQLALRDPELTAGLELRIRSGLHVGTVEARDNDYFGPSVNRAARLMSVGHGQQMLLSHAAALLVRDRLPEGTSLQDLGTLHLRDIDHAVQVHQLNHPGLPTTFPPLKGLDITPGNLPRPLTRLIGRTRELDGISTALARNRLLTLVGSGGIGKTRLAVAWAQAHGHAMADGAWFLDLTSVSDPGLVMQSLATVLGVRDEASRPLEDTVAQHLAARELLLVVDNCEHLIEAAASLVRRLLDVAEGLKVLATSREPLRLLGESLLGLEPLAVDPDSGSDGSDGTGGPRGWAGAEARPSAFAALLPQVAADPHPAQSEPPEDLPAWLSRRPAVALLAERIASARPGFEPTAAERRDMLAICRQLDGMPMALELAAARARSFTLAQIRQRLVDRFALLSSGHRNAAPRQQTLAALIDWSHDLLNEPERCLLRRLAVFPGSFSLEAAEAVVPDAHLPQAEVLPLLGELVDKSLVMREPIDGRFRLLDSVREYAVQRLEAAGERPDVRERHLDWVLAFLELRRRGLTGPDQTRLAGEIDIEQPHLASAHEWACNSGHGGLKALRLVGGLFRYIVHRGLIRVGYEQARQAIALLDATAPGEERGLALFVLASHALSLGRAAEAQEALLTARQEAQVAGLERLLAMVLQPLAHAAMELGQDEHAEAYLSEAVTIERRMGRDFETMAALSLLGQLQRTKGQSEAALGSFTEASQIARRLGDGLSVCILNVNLAMVALEREHLEQAKLHLREVLKDGRTSINEGLIGSVLDVAAAVAACSHLPQAARQLRAAADSAWQQSGTTRDPADLAFAQRWTGHSAELGEPDPSEHFEVRSHISDPLDLVRDLLRSLSPSTTTR